MGVDRPAEGKKPRAIKQVKSHLRPEEYEAFADVRKRYYFRSDYELVRGCILFGIQVLSSGGLETFTSLPEEVREHFIDAIKPFFYTMGGKVAEGKARAKQEQEQANAKEYEAPPREWVSTFLSKYYERLFYEFDQRGQRVRERDGFTQIDIMQDMVLWLYSKKTEHKTYSDWEAWALSKFKCPEAISEAQAQYQERAG